MNSKCFNWIQIVLIEFKNANFDIMRVETKMFFKNNQNKLKTKIKSFENQQMHVVTKIESFKTKTKNWTTKCVSLQKICLMQKI